MKATKMHCLIEINRSLGAMCKLPSPRTQEQKHRMARLMLLYDDAWSNQASDSDIECRGSLSCSTTLWAGWH